MIKLHSRLRFGKTQLYNIRVRFAISNINCQFAWIKVGRFLLCLNSHKLVCIYLWMYIGKYSAGNSKSCASIIILIHNFLPFIIHTVICVECHARLSRIVHEFKSCMMNHHQSITIQYIMKLSIENT